MRKPYVITNDPEDFDRIKDAIDDWMLKATDPDAWHTKKMFEKLKQTEDPGYDVEAWDQRDEWIPRGTKMI